MNFDHYSQNFSKFEQDFMSYYTGAEPLYALERDLLNVIDRNGYFRLPAWKSVDNQHHDFYFERVGDVWKYKGMEN